MDEITTIELLREVILGEVTESLHQNNVQKRKAAQEKASQSPINQLASKSSVPVMAGDNPAAKATPDYISQDEEEGDEESNHWARRSKRVQSRILSKENEEVSRVANLTTHDTTSMPDLVNNT